MAKNQDKTKNDIYNYFKSNGYEPVLKSTNGKEVSVPEEAEVIEFQFRVDGTNYGTAALSLDNEGQLKIFYSDKIENSPTSSEHGETTWNDLIPALRRMTFGKTKSFELDDMDNLEYDMAKREHSKKLEEGYHPMGKKASYSDNIPECKIVIKHNRNIEEGEQRYRNIHQIFIENVLGERFLAPTTKPGLARVYARHIAEGGKVNDDKWNHITGLCEEYSKMAGFIRATRNGQFNEDTQRLVSAGTEHYISLRESLHKLAGKRGYNNYFESWAPPLMESEGDEDLSEMFMNSSLDPRIESVIPILNRLNKNISENQEIKEVIALEAWADDVIEGVYSHDVERAFPGGKASGVKSRPAVVKTKKPIGTRVSDIGKGGKEHNVKTDKEWDKQKGVAEGQLNEIGDTPAGQAALQRYGNKAHDQVAAHWKQVHNKSHLPTDEKMAKRNSGTVAAGNRIHGFGINKNQQDKVTGRFKYRDAVGLSHVYQKKNPLEQSMAEGQWQDIDGASAPPKGAKLKIKTIEPGSAIKVDPNYKEPVAPKDNGMGRIVQGTWQSDPKGTVKAPSGDPEGVKEADMTTPSRDEWNGIDPRHGKAINQYNQRTDQLNNMYGDFQTTRPARQSDVNAGNASASDYSMAVKPLPLTRQQQHNQKVGDFYHSFPAKQSDVDAGDVDVSDYSLSRGVSTPKLARVKEADDSYDPFANDPAADAKHEADVFAKMRQQQQQGKGTSLKNMNPLDRDQYLKNTNRQWDSATQRSAPATPQQKQQPQNEDIGPQQAAVGQLGATAKVSAGGTILGNTERSQKGLRGKLVGTSESVDPLAHIIRLTK